MAQNYIPIGDPIPKSPPLTDPFNFQVGYGSSPYYLAVQRDPVGVFNMNSQVDVRPTPIYTTTTTTYTLFNNQTMKYALIGGVVLLILMRPTNRY